MSATDNAIRTALTFWHAAKDVGTSEAWYECFVQMDAMFVFHCDDNANPVIREYFNELRMAAIEKMEGA